MDLQLETLAKCAQSVEISGGRTLQRAKHQGRDIVSHGDLDLRYVAANIECGEHLAQRRDQAIERRGKDLAACEVGDERRRALAETDHHPALLGHEAGSQAGTAAVVPGRLGQGLQNPPGNYSTGATELFQQVLLLGANLCTRIEMLQRASAAESEVSASRRHAFGRRALDRMQRGLIEVTPLLEVAHSDAFAGKRPGNEERLATHVRHAAAIVGQRRDLVQGGRGTGRAHGDAPAVFQASRKRVKCGLACAVKYSRVLASSRW
jgi:hypothetical protein